MSRKSSGAPGPGMGLGECGLCGDGGLIHRRGLWGRKSCLLILFSSHFAVLCGNGELLVPSFL